MFSLIPKVLSFGLALFFAVLFGFVPAAFMKTIFLDLGLNGDIRSLAWFYPGSVIFYGEILLVRINQIDDKAAFLLRSAALCFYTSPSAPLTCGK